MGDYVSTLPFTEFLFDFTSIEAARAHLGIGTGVITLSRPGLQEKYYAASADTNSARVAALSQAIADATPGSKVILVSGSFIVPQSLALYGTHQNWKLEFSQGTWLAYANERMAETSWFAYEGENRYAENFGIFPDPSGLIDQQPRIQAALFSMIPTLEAQEAVADYPLMGCRRGKLHITYGGYAISKPVYFTSHQHILGKGTTQAVLMQMPGFAPVGHPRNEVFSLQFVRPFAYLPGPVASSNFGFEVVVDNIGFDNLDPVGNVKGSYLLMGGAQGSRINNILTKLQNMRGVVYHPYTTYFEIGAVQLLGNNPLQTGPNLEIDLCQSFSIGLLNSQSINIGGTRKKYLHDRNSPRPVETNLMAVCITSSTSFHIDTIAGELVSTMLRLKNCNDFYIGPVSVQQNVPSMSGKGETMVSITSCAGYTVGPFFGAYFEKLWAIYADSATGNPEEPEVILARSNSGNSVYSRTAAITVGGSQNVVDGDLQNPLGLSSSGLFIQRSEPPAIPATGDTPLAYTWAISAGGPANINSLYIQSLDKGKNSTAVPILILPPGGLGGGIPAGYTLMFNYDGTGGTHVYKYFNVGLTGAASGIISVNGVPVIGPRKSLVTKLTPIVSAPTMAQHNALIAYVNLLNDRLVAHGLIEPN